MELVGTELLVGEVDIFVERNFALSVRSRSQQGFMNVRTRCEHEPHLLREGSVFVFYALMDAVVDRYFPVIDALESELEAIDSIRDTISTATQVNLSMVTIDESEVNKRLAAWEAIFAVATALVGVWGMNFKSMPELQWEYGYPLALCIIMTICGYLYYRFRKSGWL